MRSLTLSSGDGSCTLRNSILPRAGVSAHACFCVCRYEQWISEIVPCLALLYLWRDARNAGPRAVGIEEEDSVPEYQSVASSPSASELSDAHDLRKHVELTAVRTGH
jgi:hypothetical protein